MKTTATFLGSAIAAGAGAAFLLSLAIPSTAPTSSGQADLFRAGSLSMRNVLASVAANPAVQALESTLVKFATAVMPLRTPGTTEMLLSEPVVILTASTDGWQRLEAGKRVSLVANEGRFIRVKYDHKEVSIPRTAVTQGIASVR